MLKMHPGILLTEEEEGILAESKPFSRTYGVGVFKPIMALRGKKLSGTKSLNKKRETPGIDEDDAPPKKKIKPSFESSERQSQNWEEIASRYFDMIGSGGIAAPGNWPASSFTQTTTRLGGESAPIPFAERGFSSPISQPPPRSLPLSRPDQNPTTGREADHANGSSHSNSHSHSGPIRLQKN